MHQLHVMLSEKDYAHMKEQQRRSGLSTSALIRSLIAGLEIRERPTEAVLQVYRELNAIGNNVNQLAFQANARGEATQEEIHEAVLLVREAVQLVRDTL